jgi:SET domain-containing protein
VRNRKKTLKLQVKKARTGRGVFAGEPIKRGQRITEYTGRVLTAAQEKRSRSRYLFGIGRKTIDGWVAGNIARFINHSCRPNCEAEIRNGRVFIFARRGIKEGEELAYDYGPQYFEEEIKPIGCKCHKCSAD